MFWAKLFLAPHMAPFFSSFHFFVQVPIRSLQRRRSSDPSCLFLFVCLFVCFPVSSEPSNSMLLFLFVRFFSFLSSFFLYFGLCWFLYWTSDEEPFYGWVGCGADSPDLSPVCVCVCVCCGSSSSSCCWPENASALGGRHLHCDWPTAPKTPASGSVKPVTWNPVIARRTR